MFNVHIAAVLMFLFGFLFVVSAARRARDCGNWWCATVYLVLGGLGAALGMFGIVLTLALVFHANGTWR